MATPSEVLPENSAGRLSTEIHETSQQVGTSRVHIRVEAPPGTRIRITLESQAADDTAASVRTVLLDPANVVDAPVSPRLPAFPSLDHITRQLSPALDLVRANALAQVRWETLFFVLALAIFMLVRVVRLPDFPIYFFTDEAVQTVLAQDFVRDGMRGYDKELFPTYFLNSYQYNLGVSVYVQVLPYLLFGKSVWVTRGVSVLFSLLAGLGVGLILKKVFRLQHAWLGVMLLSITPAWFLHSRTAFETALATSFYAMFLYFYLRYRTASPRYLYAAVILGTLTFYSYAPIRMVVGVTALLLFLSDLRYHWQNRQVVLKAFVLAAFMTIPLLRFQNTHPEETLHHLMVLNSYWIQPISLQEKFSRFFSEYLHGLNPLYWYLPNTHDLSRHLMKGYGHVLATTFPLMLAGLWVCLRNFRSSIHRALLIAVLAAPSGAALVELGITRSLVMVIPLALLSGLGLATLVEWVVARWEMPKWAVALPLFILLAYFNIYMLKDALVNGPLWYKDYGLAGMQYGANQLFPQLGEFLEQEPDARVIVSPSWSNGTDTVARFYYPGDVPFTMGSIDGWSHDYRPLDDKTVFVMIPEEYERTITSDKFTDINVIKTIPYPNGQPGFYFVRLRYVDNIDQILAEEIERRRQLVVDELDLDGVMAQVSYTTLDMGTIDQVFDGDGNTLVRTLEANPLRIQLRFSQPKALQGMAVKVGGTPTQVDVILQDGSGQVLLEATGSVEADPNPRTLEVDWGKVVEADQISISVTSLDIGEPAHVHLWEVTFK